MFICVDRERKYSTWEFIICLGRCRVLAQCLNGRLYCLCEVVVCVCLCGGECAIVVCFDRTSADYADLWVNQIHSDTHQQKQLMNWSAWPIGHDVCIFQMRMTSVNSEHFDFVFIVCLHAILCEEQSNVCVRKFVRAFPTFATTKIEVDGCDWRKQYSCFIAIWINLLCYVPSTQLSFGCLAGSAPCDQPHRIYFTSHDNIFHEWRIPLHDYGKIACSRQTYVRGKKRENRINMHMLVWCCYKIPICM